MLDTCVYIHSLKGMTPPELDALLLTRTVKHSTVAIAELTYSFGARIPINSREKKAFNELRDAIEDIPEHNILCPDAMTWAEAGVLAGLLSRVKGQNAATQENLMDSIIFMQAASNGIGIVTANLSDFDLLNQLSPRGNVIFYREV